MTDFEVFTAIGGVATVFISLWSLAVARRAEQGQREFALLAALRERRNLSAVHFQKYSDLLAEVRETTKAAKQDLHSNADEVLQSLCNLVDEVAPREAPRYSRHLFYDMSEGLYESFRSALSIEHEERILMRYGAVRRKLREVGDSCRGGEIRDANLDWIERLRARFASRLRAPSHRPPEQDLLSSNWFFRIYSEMDARLDRSSARTLLLEATNRIEKFSEAQRRVRDTLEAGHQRLASALDRNSAEEFKLRESPELWSKIQAEMRSLGLMTRLELNDLEYFQDHMALDALAEFVHAGAVLFTVALVADQSISLSDPLEC